MRGSVELHLEACSYRWIGSHRILVGTGFYQCPNPADYPSYQDSIQPEHYAGFIGVWIVLVEAWAVRI